MTDFISLFNEQVIRSPDDIAVRGRDRQITYRELNAVANRLANRLIAAGAGHDKPVGVCYERSIEMIIALLAIMKAGGAYLPLDPEAPRDRLAYMIEEIQPIVLLAQKSLIPRLPNSGVPLLWLTEESEEIFDRDTEDRPCEPNERSLAYILYTSGSTGRPKAVMIEHRSLTHFISTAIDAYELLPSDRILQFASLTFDASVEEIFPCLSVGGTLVLRTEEMLGSTAEFWRSCSERGITVLDLPTAYWHELARTLSHDAELVPSSLRLVIIGGESVRPDRLRQWRSSIREGVRLINTYGPSETTVVATLCDITNAPEDDLGAIASAPIGKAFGNARLRILDPRHQSAPDGESGELHIGGAGVARGYFNRPDLTADRFVSDPLACEPETRLYRTGDRVRRRADGNLEFLGRFDDQVKIRGIRIEPGEIETVLRQHPSVREAAVLAKEDPAGETFLAAYLALNAVNMKSGATSVSNRENATASESDRVSDWRTVYDELIYGPDALSAPSGDPTFNIAGWNSSYTGQPLPEEEMREWVHHTVSRILSSRPRRLWEIGCGAGLLLFRLAPHCLSYRGTDFSQGVVDYLRELLAKPEHSSPQVEIERRTADDFSGIEPGSYDAIALNSVLMHFPNVDYLLEVLRRSVETVEPGGFIFIGDVRNLALLETFHASVEMSRADGASLVSEVRRRYQRRAREERELLIHPDFFAALPNRFPEISGVQIHPKRGSYRNEMTLFRYDVTLHIGPRSHRIAPQAWLDAGSSAITTDEIRRQLERGIASLAIRNLADSRVESEIRTIELLEASPPDVPIERIRERLRKGGGGISPEALLSLSERWGYRIDIRLSQPYVPGRYDAYFRREGSGDEEEDDFWFNETIAPPESRERYANDPTGSTSPMPLSATKIKEYLRERLPEPMIPSRIAILERMPLTRSGKLDRQALRAIPIGSEEDEQEPPQNRLEERLSEIWKDVLSADSVGVTDDFFDIGGHSLLAVRLLQRIEKEFGRSLPVSLLLHAPTIREMAERLRVEERPTVEPPLVMIHRGGDSRPFFCIKAIDGSLLRFRSLSQYLGEDQSFYALEAPEWNADSRIRDRIEAEASRFIEAIRSVQANGPYLLGGWCSGGIVAYEMARQLREREESVALLALFDCPLLYFSRDPRQSRIDRSRAYRAQVWLDRQLRYLLEFEPEDQRTYLLKRARSRLIEKIKGLLGRSNSTARPKDPSERYEPYSPKPYSGRVVHFIASEEPITFDDDRFNWYALVDEGVDTIFVPGKMGTKFEEPHVKRFAEKLKGRIAEATRNGAERSL